MNPKPTNIDNQGDNTMNDFHKEMTDLINKYGLEFGSNTPDFILADYLLACLVAFNTTHQKREKWSENADAIQD